MKAQSLKLNQIVQAEVVELQGSRALIVSLSGDLFRVVNGTEKKFKLSERVSLKVIQVRPLAFQLINQKSSQGISFTV